MLSRALLQVIKPEMEPSWEAHRIVRSHRRSGIRIVISRLGFVPDYVLTFHVLEMLGTNDRDRESRICYLNQTVKSQCG